MAIILRHLPLHLPTVTVVDKISGKPGKQGWCNASADLLGTMHQEGNLAFEGFRQATLCSGDAVSSLIGLSQPVSDNKWAFVPFVYDEDGEVDLCIVQILFFARIAVGAGASVPGFCPEQCNAAGVHLPLDPDGNSHKTEPLRVAVTKLWLAEARNAATGAVGCVSSYGEASGQVPDLMVVSNMSEQGRFRGRGCDALRKGAKGRYYGNYLVDIDHLRCQVVRAGTDGGPQYFLTCGKLSGKA